MLVLFVCIFLHYVFLHCVENKENINDGFLDYSITEFWWNGTPGIDQTNRVTIQYEFMPTPPGHGKLFGPGGEEINDGTPPWQGPATEKEHTLPNITRPAYPFPLENAVTPRTPPPHIQFPNLTPPSNFPPDYRFPTVLPHVESAAYSPSPTGPVPRGPSFTLPSVSLPKFTYGTPDTNGDFQTKWDPQRELQWAKEMEEERKTSTTGAPMNTDIRDPVTTTPVYDPKTAYALKWLQQIRSEAAVVSTLRDRMPNIGRMFNYDYKTSAERFSHAIRQTARRFNTETATSAARESRARGADRRA